MTPKRLFASRLWGHLLSIICAIAGHKAAAKTLWNQGTHFAKCERCALDLVEQQGRWDVPPPWFRVVWKRPEEAAVAAPLELTMDLLADAVSIAPVEEAIAPAEEERSRSDRRKAGSDWHPASLRIDRRRDGERRNPVKQQAIVRA